ncbi:MAG TPA: EamA family transporter [Candidatus Woesebacteria bacterium]|nr:EamA family transporter [Candidatus Woesebacteria bacterium]HNS95095.1 EamA family transporter [Candidatus Woesebacteria bacterium]
MAKSSRLWYKTHRHVVKRVHKHVNGLRKHIHKKIKPTLHAHIKHSRSIVLRLLDSLKNPYIALAVAYLIWGATAPISKLTLTEIGPFSLLLLRTIIASFILLPFVLKHKITFTFHEQSFIALSAFFSVFLHILLFYLALPLIPSINASMIGVISPFIFVIMARMFLGEHASPRKYYGMFFGLLGVFCITVLPFLFPPSDNVLGVSTTFLATLRTLGIAEADLSGAQLRWLGHGLLILGVFIGAVGPLFLKPLRHFPGIVLTFWQFALVACFTLPFALLENPDLYLTTISWKGLLGLVYIAIPSSVVAYSLYNHGLQNTKAADVGLFSYLAPISALLVGIPLLHEYPDLWFIIGSALVLVGVWIAERHLRHKYPRHTIVR